MLNIKVMGDPPIGPAPNNGLGGRGGGGGRISRDEMFMEMATALAKRSTCQRAQVGALIVDEGRIISCGYNGPISGEPECREVGGCLGSGCDRSIHAELNAILFAAKAGIGVEGCTLYCTMSPCLQCSQAIVNCGIERVVYKKLYRIRDGLDLLQKHLVRCDQLYEESKVLRWIYFNNEYFCPVCYHKINEPANCGGVCPYCFNKVGVSDEQS